MTLTRADARSRSEAISDLAYTVRLDLTGAPGAGATFRSTTEARFTTSQPRAFIDLVAEEVLAVEVDGAGADAEVHPGRVVVENLPTGTPITLRIVADCRYSRSGEGLHRYRDPEDGNTYLYTQYEPMDAHRVYACFDQPDLKATWDFTIDAPAGWTVLSNQPATAAEDLAAGATRHTFATTPPLSSYLTCVIAGPYHRVTGPTWRGTFPERNGGPEVDVEVPLAAYCRAALADRLDADDVFAITSAGLTFFHERYQFAYPWGKYDQVFVPEYNLGAMENPGCVTFNEHLIPQGEPTPTERAGRGNTILHEMCHMWFGDLVTPRWWDDLWLKESFADHEGTAALAACTEHTDAWATFAFGRKAWAYSQDQLPTTHPIVADIPDVAAAKQNFDGITYAKGAAVLRQLVAYVGEETFVAAARRFFAEHAFSAATAEDLLAALGHASGRDMGAWADAWLRTSGPSVIELSADGSRLTQDALDGVSHVETMRPHRLLIGEYDADDAGLTCTARRSFELAERELVLDPPAGGALRIVNDQDLTYAVVRLGEASRAVALDRLSEIADPLARAVLWSALWNEVRDAVLPARDFVAAVLRHGGAETEPVLAGLLRRSVSAARTYTAAATRGELLTRMVDGFASHAAEAGAPSRAKLWAQALCAAIGERGAGGAETLRAIEAGTLAGVPRDRDLVWDAVCAAAAIGHYGEPEIGERAAADASGYVAVRAIEARASIPTAATATRVWRDIWAADLTNEHLDAIIAGFASSGRAADFDAGAGYFERIDEAWASRSIQMGERLAVGMFPSRVDITETPEGATGTPDPTANRIVRATDAWLSGSEDAPKALKRRVIEGRDEAVRALRAQAL